MKTLLIVEHDGQNVSLATRQAATAASQLGGQLEALVLSGSGDQVAKQVAKLSGVDKVYLASGDIFTHASAEVLADVVVKASNGFGALVCAATTWGKNFMPRVAALLDVMQISDVIKVHTDGRFDRPIYAGNAIQTLESVDKVKVLTVRSTAFDAMEDREECTIEAITISPVEETVEFVGQSVASSDRPDLTSARVVISGGRGMGSAENFAKLGVLADKLKAAIGASRAAVDSGFAPNDLQVGQTGKIVAPELYIAIGISGAIQHLAGIKDAKVIVAINKDEEAPIFQVATFGLVGDWQKILPELEASL